MFTQCYSSRLIQFSVSFLKFCIMFLFSKIKHYYIGKSSLLKIKTFLHKLFVSSSCTNQEISRWALISDLPHLCYLTNKWMPILSMVSPDLPSVALHIFLALFHKLCCRWIWQRTDSAESNYRLFFLSSSLSPYCASSSIVHMYSNRPSCPVM